MSTAAKPKKSDFPSAPPEDWRTSRHFLTAQEVMHLTGLPRAIVYLALESGAIPGKEKIHSLVRVRVKEFAAWLDGAGSHKRGAA